MKKVFLSLLLASAVAGFTNAQESVGGIPWSMSNRAIIENQKVSVLNLPAPDYAKAKLEDAQNEASGKPGKYRAGLAVKTNINFNNSGTFTYLADGSKIWKLQIVVPEAAALKIIYEDFVLPQGITYYIQNGNGKQLIGGFDYTSNTDAQSMRHGMVQGNVINLEMDIQPNVDINKAVFQINNIYAMYRAVGEVNNTFGNATVMDYQINASNACQVNAICDQAKPWFSSFSNAVAHVFIVDGVNAGFCSGTLINNTARDCSPYFLTASHCDGNNAYSSANFSQWEFTFDFYKPICAGGGTPNESRVLKGADFKSRSYLDFNETTNVGTLFGDFILLKLKDPQSKLKTWGTYLAGWDKTGTKDDSLWIGFHHPAGDVMKFSKFNIIDSLGYFNNTNNPDSPGTHWSVSQVIGGVEGGSSGSGLWRGSTGMLIGDLSGGVTISNPCLVGHQSLYSKISHNWTNDHDAVYYNDTISVTNTQLHNWLDPGNTNVSYMEMGKVGTTCEDTIFRYPGTITSIGAIKALESGISIYPNPTTGKVSMMINLATASDLNIEVLNILGQKTNSYFVKKAGSNQETSFDLSMLPNGIYLMKISSEDATITKKIILRK